MRPPSTALLDTSIWIPYLRWGHFADVVDPLVAAGRVYVTSVVLLELYAGAGSRDDKRAIDEIASAAHRLDRFSHPSEADFALAGQIMSSYAERHGAVRARDHSHDLLIAIAAGRTSSELISENGRDMKRWADALAKRSRLRVKLREVAAP